jgi:hypothetical protein
MVRQSLADDALEAHAARVHEEQGAVLVVMLAEDDADPPAKQPGQPLLAVAQRQVPKILAVKLQEVQGVQHGLADGAAAMQITEHRDAIRTAHHGLFIDRKRRAPQSGRFARDRRMALAPVVAARGKETDAVAVAAACSL